MTVVNDGPSALYRFGLLLVLSLLAACGTLERGGSGGGYYQDDGPPRRGEGPDPRSVPDAVPRVEPPSAGGNRPYQALGRSYRPMASARGYREKGEASWYGRKYHGRRTSNGEVYDMFAMSAAHPTLPLPTYVRVTSLNNGRSVVVRVNDRGPFLGGRIIDLSWMAAEKLGIAGSGTGRVEVAAIDPQRWNDERGAPVRIARGDSVEPVEPIARIGSTTAPAAEPGRATEVVGRILPAAAAAEPALRDDGQESATATRVESRYVQAGSFAMRTNAENLRSRLIGAGFDPVSLSSVDGGDRVMFRVRVGPLADEREIESRRRAVERVTGVRAIVVGDRSLCPALGC
jgi:rare lipoprotein A